MSATSGANDHEAERNETCRKPSHVRRLNFGQSILSLNVVDQFRGQANGRLIIDQNVAGIPCTEKGEFVRKWIETHEANASDSNDESCRSSPILGSSTTKRVETSPILGNWRKRARGKASLNNSTIERTERIYVSATDHGVDKRVAEPFERSTPRRTDQENGKENVKENRFGSPRTSVPLKNSSAEKSPIFDKSSYSYKRRRRKNQRPRSDRKPLMSVQNNRIDTNMNVVSVDNTDNTGREKSYGILSSQKYYALLEELEENLEETVFDDRTIKNYSVSGESVVPPSPVSERKVYIEESPKDSEDITRIETESSRGSNSGDCKSSVNIVSTSDKTENPTIEDVDTQDAECAPKCTRVLTHGLSETSKPPSINSQTSNTVSDKTFFSKGESMIRHAFTGVLDSQKISEVSSRANDSKSSEIVISTETSPRRGDPEPGISVNILDSGKKRRKPKKGSLSEKLQTLISSQISFLRIWRHQIKQASGDNSTAGQRVIVYVQKCSTRFGRQFLEGIVLEDRFELLPVQEAGDTYRRVTIVTIPDIVGRIEMKAESTVQISPPWEILDYKRLILNVTYISIVSDNGRLDIGRNTGMNKEAERPVVKVFDCPCIVADRVLPHCGGTADKPNVMEIVFSG